MSERNFGDYIQDRDVTIIGVNGEIYKDPDPTDKLPLENQDTTNLSRSERQMSRRALFKRGVLVLGTIGVLQVIAEDPFEKEPAPKIYSVTEDEANLEYTAALTIIFRKVYRNALVTEEEILDYIENDDIVNLTAREEGRDEKDLQPGDELELPFPYNFMG